jgi:methylated-DNA-[protein]-cysteine S-methyltransferase
MLSPDQLLQLAPPWWRDDRTQAPLPAWQLATEAWCLAGDDTPMRNLAPPPEVLAKATPFRQQVWQVLALIPWGQTLSYGQLAQQLGYTGNGMGRAVGQALAANPNLLYWPCHRIVGAKGQLTGFQGRGDATASPLALKQALLAHEAATLQAHQKATRHARHPDTSHCP